MKRFKAFVLSVCLICLFSSSALCATHGPATSYEQLLELAASAKDGDVLLISGDLSAEGQSPLSSQAFLHITSGDAQTAKLRSMQLADANITFSNIELHDSLSITGTSYVELTDGVRVKGAPGKSAVRFEGSGTLLLYPGSRVEGGENGEGVHISHRGGDFYAGIEGSIIGGSGHTGGHGLTVSPLGGMGTLMISGEIRGGSGRALGGHALNLYDLSGNAYITVTGSVEGGSGSIGGDGVQIVAAKDNVNIGIHGSVFGGLGEEYGGDALILMNVSGAASVNLAGILAGGDVTRLGAKPGMSLLVVGDTSATHTRVGDCILQDGRDLAALNATPTPEPTPEPDVTPLPEITSSVEDAEKLETPTPAPETTAPPQPETTPEPSVTPAPQESIEPTAPPTLEPTLVPTEAPTKEPTAAPEITPEMTEGPTPLPPVQEHSL